MKCEENGSISYKPIFDVFINTKCNANDLHFLYLVIDWKISFILYNLQHRVKEWYTYILK